MEIILSILFVAIAAAAIVWFTADDDDTPSSGVGGSRPVDGPRPVAK